MKILMINSVCGILSTGRICTDLALELEKRGHNVKIAYGRKKVPSEYERFAVRIGTDSDLFFHGIRARLTDGSGWGSEKATKKFIKWIAEYNPDVIHLHNLHGYYINVEILFNFLRNFSKKIIWTLHDCWPFTGHAAYCDVAGCTEWMVGCSRCINKYDYPFSFVDKSFYNWRRKKELFQGIKDMKIITPSSWLADLVKKSFLSDYDVSVINNGINVEKFKRTTIIPVGLDEKILKKNIVVGVASEWSNRKGLRDFIKLSQMLDDRYQIILIGLNKKQLLLLPKEIIGKGKTNSIEELVQYYSLADVFVNPTYEDNYPTTNLEAISCGVPVITYDTGGSSESAKHYGCVIPKGDLIALSKAIMNYKEIKECKKISKLRNFSRDNMIKKYISAYNI